MDLVTEVMTEEKTEVISTGRECKELKTEIKGKQLKQMKEFKYLGSRFTEDGKIDREIETRVRNASALQPSTLASTSNNKR